MDSRSARHLLLFAPSPSVICAKVQQPGTAALVVDFDVLTLDVHFHPNRLLHCSVPQRTALKGFTTTLQALPIYALYRGCPLSNETEAGPHHLHFGAVFAVARIIGPTSLVHNQGLSTHFTQIYSTCGLFISNHQERIEFNPVATPLRPTCRSDDCIVTLLAQKYQQ